MHQTPFCSATPYSPHFGTSALKLQRHWIPPGPSQLYKDSRSHAVITQHTVERSEYNKKTIQQKNRNEKILTNGRDINTLVTVVSTYRCEQALAAQTPSIKRREERAEGDGSDVLICAFTPDRGEESLLLLGVHFEKTPFCHHQVVVYPWECWSEFLVVGCHSSHQPARIREETLESGKLFSGSWISASIPYGGRNYIFDTWTVHCTKETNYKFFWSNLFITLFITHVYNTVRFQRLSNK